MEERIDTTGNQMANENKKKHVTRNKSELGYGESTRRGWGDWVSKVATSGGSAPEGGSTTVPYGSKTGNQLRNRN